MTKRDITSGDIYDQLKIPAKQQPVQMDFWDALPGYIYGAEQIAKIQLTIGLPAVLIRVLLHLWVLDGMHTVTFALILLLELPLFALLFPIRCMVRYAACNDPDWPLLLTREENRAFWTQKEHLPDYVSVVPGARRCEHPSSTFCRAGIARPGFPGAARGRIPRQS